MPVPLTIDFLPPTIPGIVALHIYEAPSLNATFNPIERTTAIGTYPNYITRYVTTLANSKDDYFTIAWENAQGEITEMSAAVQGGTITLVGMITDRVLLRDPSLNENIAAQEAEAAISDYFNVFDPYTVDPSTVSPKVMNGLTLLALGWAEIVSTAISSSAQKFTAGLVSLDLGSSSTKTTSDPAALIAQAEKMLGRGFTRIFQLADLEVSSGYTQLVSVDLSRGIFELQ